MPSRSQISKVSRCMHSAFDPSPLGAGCSSSRTTLRPRCARRPAKVMPIGPAPTTPTWASSAGMLGIISACRGSGRELVPGGAVALHRPDARMVDAIQLVPRALHVEGHGVLEDREAAVAWCEG